MILYMNKKDCNILKIKIRFELEKYLKRDKSILEDEKKYNKLVNESITKTLNL